MHRRYRQSETPLLSRGLVYRVSSPGGPRHRAFFRFGWSRAALSHSGLGGYARHAGW